MPDRPDHVWTYEQAREHLDEVVSAAAAGVPQTVERHGTSVVVLDAAEFARLDEARRAHNRAFAAHLLSFPQLPDGDEDFVLDRLPMRMRDIEF